MDDVIFAGTSKRPALGRAEVALTIDNSAGLLPIEFTEVTLTRTLFRTGDSEYAINGVPCRLLDIQDLLSDTGVGRQQHVIVSQGQIDAVLNARPEDRRLIIEEAAGILKYRKRKEKAERRLAATEGNLTRLGDLLREVRRQLRPLERQADAARRHGDLVAELRALQVFLAGRELTTLTRRLVRRHRGSGRAGHRGQPPAPHPRRARHRGPRRRGRARTRRWRRPRRRAGALRVAAREGAWAGRRARRATPRDRPRAGRLRRPGRDRHARGRGHPARGRAGRRRPPRRPPSRPQRDELARAEGALEEARTAFERDWADGVPALTGRAAESRGELAALRSGVERGTQELARATTRLATLEEKLARLDAEAARLRADAEAAEAAEAPARRAARRRRAGSGPPPSSRSPTPRTALRAADGDRHAWTARAEALSLALDDARARAGAERLADRRRRRRHAARPGRDRSRLGGRRRRRPPAKRSPRSSSTASTPLVAPSSRAARRRRRTPSAARCSRSARRPYAAARAAGRHAGARARADASAPT